MTLSGIHKQTQKAHQPSREPFDSEGCVLDQCTEGGIDGGFGVNKLITCFAFHVSCLTLAKKDLLLYFLHTDNSSVIHLKKLCELFERAFQVN